MPDNSSLTVVPVETDAQLDMFIRLPWAFNSHDPYWVPPTISLQRKMLDKKKGPFFEFGEAQYYLALRGGEPVGRITSHINRMHDERYQDRTGFFGFFECENNKETAGALFEEAAAWLRQRDRVRIRGPLSFGIYDEVGLLVEGFDSLPRHPAYSQPSVLCRSRRIVGFCKGQRLVCLAHYSRSGDR